MTEEHFGALLKAADAKREGDWFKAREGRQITLYAAANGANLTVARVEALRLDGGIVHARNTRGETYVLALVDVFAGATEGPQTETRKAGFAHET
jgi:hypothetical protein